MSSLASAVGLTLVRGTTRAINANLPKDGPLGTIRPGSAQLYARQRRYYTPAGGLRPGGATGGGAKYQAQAVHGYRDRYDGCPAVCCDRPVPPGDGVNDGCWRYTLGRRSCHGRYPFDPVWAHLPPVNDGRTVIKIQVVRQTADLNVRGTALDLFA